jgi:hypothetical protein
VSECERETEREAERRETRFIQDIPSHIELLVPTDPPFFFARSRKVFLVIKLARSFAIFLVIL